MRSLEQVPKLIDLIYQASISRELWPDVLQEIQAGFSGCGVILGVEAKGRPQVLEGSGFDRAAMDYLGRKYAGDSLVWRLLPRVAEGERLYGRHVMTESVRRRDGFAGERVKVTETAHYEVFPLLRREDLTAFVVFARPFSRQAFDPETLEFLQMLAGHLQRAVQIQARLEQANLHADLALNVMERLEDAILFVTPGGCVTFANQAAMRMLAGRDAGLALQEARLRGKTREADAALQGMLAGAFGAPGRRRAGVVMVARNGRRPVAVFCTPLEAESERHLGREPAAVLLLSDTESGMRTPAGLLRELFGLSAAEARLAFRLANGDSLNAAAASFGVAKSTVVSQLGGIFFKTQTSRQSELIGLLRDLPRLCVGPEL